MRAPILRFAEFTDDWEETTLENLAEVERGKFSVRPRNDPRYFGGEMPFVQTGDVTGSDMYLKGYSQTLNADGIKVSKVFPADTILITIAANIGDTTITQYAVACPDSVVAIQAKKDLANTIFLKNLIDLQKENLDSQATQNAQKNINLQVLKPLQLIAPSKAEQTKITTFLSAVDEKISQLSQKLHLLGQYKQGMMQKLFSQQIRFKADDDREFMEWEEKELKNVVEINPKAKKLPENFIYIDLESVEKGRLLLQKNIALQDAPSRAQRLLAKGDVLFQMVRPYQQNNYYFNLSGEYVASTGYAQIRTKLDSKFIYYALHEKTFLDEVMNRCTGTSYPAINSSDLSSIEILIPCLEEQTKIANFLSAIDQKIDVVSEQLEQAKLWKKGLLQQMFV
ncbi:restriction endonuclease subunit S (plasmid) [Acinetobacter sp. SWBY1]|nr:restriction endonuclease subunit S [Acinetobacter sp. SWBY1]AVH50770.1 restriction endonuclease subunit S [Acinetobacter sp. SWBY1]